MSLPPNAKIVIDLSEHDRESGIDFKKTILEAQGLSQKYGRKVQLVRGLTAIDLLPFDAKLMRN